MRPLLLDYPDLDFWFHVRVKPDGHAEYAQRLERLMQIHLPLLDLEPLSLQLRRDVRRGDGTEQLSFLANARGEGERDLLELFGESLGRVATLVLRRFQPVLFLGDAFEVSGSRLEGDTARQEKIARVSVRDLHDVAGLTQVLDGLTKNDFHSSGSGEWSVGKRRVSQVVLRARRRQSAHVSPRPSPSAAIARNTKPSAATTPSTGKKSMANPTVAVIVRAPGAMNQLSTPSPRIA